MNREAWYNNGAVMYELLRAMRDREVVLMDNDNHRNCIHWLVVRNKAAFKNTLMDYYRLAEKNYNVYVSLARYDFIPPIPFDLKIRSEKSKEWNKEAQSHILGYDMLLDFDYDKKHKKPFSYMQKMVYKMCQILDLYKIKYNVFPSGNNFQIVIPYDNFKHHIPKGMKAWEYVKLMTFLFRERFVLRKYLCLGSIGNWNKIRKCEYSLVINKPLIPFKNSGRLKNFNYETIARLTRYSVFMRGLCYQNEADDIILKRNWDTFIKENYLELENANTTI